MKAKEVAEILLQHPEYEVVVASDEEGNSFHVVYKVEQGTGNPDEFGYEYEVGIAGLTEDMRALGFTEDDVMETPVFVIWP